MEGVPIDMQKYHKLKRRLNSDGNMETIKINYKEKIWFIVFNATFSNISAISWQSVLVVEEAGLPGENHRSWASNW